MNKEQKDLNILIYREPWIVGGKPDLSQASFCNIIKSEFIPLIQHSKSTDTKINISILCSEANYNAIKSSKDNFEKFGIAVHSISQKELNEYFYSYYDYHKKLSLEKDQKAIQNFKDFITNKIKLKPDLIITFTETQFFKYIFPESLTLFLEGGLFNRKPLPQLLFMDYNLASANSFWVKNKDKLIDLNLDSKQKARLNNLKDSFANTLKKGKAVSYVNNIKQEFKYVLFLPLQKSAINFDFFCEFANQSDYLIYVLSRLDKEVAVIVTEHPHNFNFGLKKDINDDLISYLKNKHENFFYLEDCTFGQELLPLVDGAISISSSVGIQSMFYNKFLFTVGSANLSHFSDCDDISKIYQTLKTSKAKNRDGLLYFLFTRYWIPIAYYSDPKWKYEFLKRSYDKFISNSLDYDFFDKIDEEEKIFEHLKTIFDRNIKEPINDKKIIQNSDLFLTIGIPTYNVEDSIAKTLTSLVSQISNSTNINNIEILVCDNCSTDSTQDIIQDIIKKNKNVNIRYQRNNTNIGPIKNVYEVIKSSNGKYVWLLGDDLAEEGSIEYLLNKLNNDIIDLSALIMRANYYDEDLKNNFGKSRLTNNGKNILLNNPVELLNHGVCRLFFIGGYVLKKEDALDVINQNNYNYDGFFPHTDILLKIIQKQNKNILIVEEKNLVGQRSVDRWQFKDIADTNAKIAFSFIETILSNINKKDFKKLSKARQTEYLRLRYTIEKISSIFVFINNKYEVLERFLQLNCFYRKLDKFIIFLIYKLNKSYAIYCFQKMIKFYSKNHNKRFFKLK